MMTINLFNSCSDILGIGKAFYKYFNYKIVISKNNSESVFHLLKNMF